MDPNQITVPEWLLALVGRHVVLAEAQRLQDAATIAALRADVQRLTPVSAETTSVNGAVREEVGALEG